MWPRTQLLLLIGVAWLWLLTIVMVAVLILAAGIAPDVRAAVADAAGREWVWLLVAALLALAIPVGILALARVRARSTLRRLAADARLIAAANPAYAATPTGDAARDELAAAIQALGSRIAALEDGVEQRVALARADAHAASQRLAALIDQLPPALLVCDALGVILLSNAAARRLFADGGPGASGSQAGVGRPVDALLDPDHLAHAQAALARRIGAGAPDATQRFACTDQHGRRLLVHLVAWRGAPADTAAAAADPAPDAPAGRLRTAASLLTLEDVTEPATRAQGLHAAAASATADLRDAMAGIRACIDALRVEAAPPADDPAALLRVIDEEARAADGILQGLERRCEGPCDWHGAFEATGARELLAAAAARIAAKLGARVEVDDQTVGAAAPLLIVDSHALVQALAGLASLMHYEFETGDFFLIAHRQDAHLALDLQWQGTAPDAELWRVWERQPLRHGGEASALSVAEVAARHGGAVWYQRAVEGARPAIRLLLPVAGVEPEIGQGVAADTAASMAAPYPGLPAPAAAHDRTALADLPVTSISIEAGGGQPARIISLDAARIVNRQLLAGEEFAWRLDTTADAQPGTPMPVALDAALPALHRHCAGSVLVGTAMADVMPLLHAVEVRTGTAFTQPAFDLLLLARAIEQQSADSSLDGLAERLGLATEATGGAARARKIAAVWLRLLPLLAQQGIVSLQDGLAAQAAAATGVRSIRPPAA